MKTRMLLESYRQQRRRDADTVITLERTVDALLAAAEGDDTQLREIIERRKETRVKRNQ